jgi:hypothetical protein
LVWKYTVWQPWWESLCEAYGILNSFFCVNFGSVRGEDFRLLQRGLSDETAKKWQQFLQFYSVVKRHGGVVYFRRGLFTRVTRFGEFSPIGWLFSLGIFKKLPQ